MNWKCGVLNCGGAPGACVHELTGEACPRCGMPMVRVKPTGHEFCCDTHAICEYERPAKIWDRGGQRNENNEGDLVCN